MCHAPEAVERSLPCSSIIKRCECKYRASGKCNFAHTFEELTLTECKFGSRCKRPISGDKMCLAFHPTWEDEKKYCKRIGFRSVKQKKSKTEDVGDGWIEVK